MYELPYQPYSLYRREDLYIRDEFDQDNGTEEDLKANLIKIEPIIVRTLAKGNGYDPFSQIQQSDESGTNYWSLYTNQEGAVTLKLDNSYVPTRKGMSAKFFEFKADAGVFGPGILYTSVLKTVNKIIDPPTFPVIPVSTGTNVYGNNIDLSNARLIFGNIGFNYIFSDTPYFSMPTFTADDIVVGGIGAEDGIPDVPLNGAVRLWGISRFETQMSVQEYSNLHNNYDRNGNSYYKIIINSSEIVQKFFGPCSWQISNYHRLCLDEMIQFYYYCGLRTDPIPRCEIDNLVIYPYYQIDCEMAQMSPMKSDTAPKKLEILRGLNVYQTTSNISASTDLVLRFYNFESHTDFVSNCDKPHVLCDEKGVTYRGVVELGEVTYLGSGLYEQKLKFNSSNKLGVGWR